MADVFPSQDEADRLIQIEKSRESEEPYDFPSLGGFLSIPVSSRDRRERFLLDVNRRRIVLTQATFNLRYRELVVLVRLDLDGAPHRNPDRTEVATPHIHLYQAGYNDKWAYPVSLEDFRALQDLSQTLDDFMRYCNVTSPPIVRRTLW